MTMTPQPTLNILGAILTAIRQAESGVLLTVRIPAQPDSLLLSEETHLAFFPVMTMNLPPGVMPSPEALHQAQQNLRPQLMLRTHTGALPAELLIRCEPIAPELFEPIIGKKITGVLQPGDGSGGVVLSFAESPHLLQIDLTGINLLEVPEPQDYVLPN